MMNHNYSSMLLFVRNHVKNYQASPTLCYASISNYEASTFKEPFLSSQPKHKFNGDSRVRKLTEKSGVPISGDYDGNFVLLECTSASECNSLEVRNSECNDYCFRETIQAEFEYIFIARYEIVRLTTEDKIIDFISNTGYHMVVYAIAVGEKYS